MHQAATPSNQESVATSPKGDVEGRKFARKIVSLIVVISAVVITLYVWGIIERHPRTDDATARANVVGIAPRVSGQTNKLNAKVQSRPSISTNSISPTARSSHLSKDVSSISTFRPAPMLAPGFR